MFATVQTVAGCPENCSFCSVWVTDGRQPRQRLTDKIIEEVNELYDLGFRHIVFADDNFNPATLGRIAREPSSQKRKQFQQIREERLEFFNEYDRSVPRNLFAFTQMTTEVTSDEEYLSAMYHKMRVRAALIGVESFSEEGLKTANKRWNPVGRKMVETIQKIQDKGILVLSSIICGLDSDTVQTIRTIMMSDRKNHARADFVPKHKTQLLEERFWLKPVKPVEVISHTNISRDDLITENKKCWDALYSLKEAVKRMRRGRPARWPLAAKLTYLLLCLGFKRIYSGHGVAADSVRRKDLGIITRTIIRIGVATYNSFCRRENVRVGPPLAQPARRPSGLEPRRKMLD
jgi:hypothetical protein